MEESENFTTYVEKLEKSLREAHDVARRHLKMAAERQKMVYDNKVKLQTYKVGDLVWRNQKKSLPGIKTKIARHWTGPWIITEKLSEIIFKIKCYKIPPL